MMASDTPLRSPTGDEHWREFLTTGSSQFEKRGRRLFGRLPANPRCKACSAPFGGVGAPLMRLVLGKKQSTLDPRFCNHCTDFMRKMPGGAEIEISMLFADVRGSTRLAEGRTPSEFSHFINRFYSEATDVLLSSGAIVDRLIGDEVVGIFVPGLAGEDYARCSFNAGKEILKATGHEDPEGPWIPVGVGLHYGVSYVGTVGKQSGAMDLTALGDVPNVAARLAAVAEPGGIVVSEQLCQVAGLELASSEHQRLPLKGREGEVEVRIFRIGETE